jgi:hypothetical protein
MTMHKTVLAQRDRVPLSRSRERVGVRVRETGGQLLIPLLGVAIRHAR